MYKLCFYSSATEYGGAEKYLEILAKGCSQNGYDCTVVLNAKNDRLISRLKDQYVPHHPIAINPYNPYMYYKFGKIINDLCPDILHINLPGPWSCPLIATTAKFTGIKKIVTTEHLPMFGPSIRHSSIKSLDSKYITKTITVSHENVQYLEGIHKIDKNKICVVHNGIDVDKYVQCDKTTRKNVRDKHGFNDSDFIIGIVGRLTEQKGHKYAIQALAEIVKDHKEIKLAVIGDGELMSSLNELTASLGLAEYVKFMGFQSDMNSIYSMMDLLLMPSTFEALPLTLIEAMATGLPVIASDINGIPEVIENNVSGMLVPPRDVASLIRVISNICGNKKLIEMKSAARERILKNFSVEKMVKDTECIYTEIYNK